MADPTLKAGWSPDRDAALKALAAGGASLSDAARELETTKAAVTGRARRLKVTFSGSVSAGIRAAAARRGDGDVAGQP